MTTPNRPDNNQPTLEASNVHALTVLVCQDCIDLKGAMCNNAQCVFCRRTMVEVQRYLDVMLLCPIVDGKRLILVGDAVTNEDTRVRVDSVAPRVDDAETRTLSLMLAEIEKQFHAATTHDEVAALVWACHALTDADAEDAPFFTPEAQDCQLVNTTALRLYFEHAERVLRRAPYPAEVDEIETGFCTPRLQRDVIARLERGRRLLTEIQKSATAPPAPKGEEAARDQRSALDEIEAALISIADGVSPQEAVGKAFNIINYERVKLNAAATSTDLQSE